MKDVKKPTSNSRDRSTRKLRKILNEEARLGIDGNSDSDTEAVDLHKELHSLSHYINNRDEMIEQMFSIIKGAKLRRMLPPILKDTPLDELKADCLIHLLGMSRKRIMAILEGKEINSSSDSETNSDSSTSPSKKAKVCVKPIVIKQEGCSDISDNSEEVVLVDPDLESLGVPACSRNTKDPSKGSAKCKRHHRQKRKNTENKTTKSNKKIVHENIKRSDEKEESHVLIQSSSEDESEKEAPTQGKTLLEILELEMRARAIRALLHKGGTPGEGNENKTEQPSHNTTDSTSEQVTPLKKTKTNDKVTPVKNFRKRKHKNDDVIVVTPKLVTIDLTDENDPSNVKTKIIGEGIGDQKHENLLNSTENNNTKEVEEVNRSQLNNLEDNSGESDVKSDTKGVSKNKNPISNEPASLGLAAKECEQSTSENSNKKAEQTKSSWAQRWLDSKEVKKVVSTSKICGNIRKRFKSAKLAKKTQENPLSVGVQSKVMQGSVDEYQLLVKSSKLSCDNEVPGTSNIEASSDLILPEGDKESPKVKNVKEAETSVEQVQDVTSTKCEPHSERILQEPTDSQAELNGPDKCNIISKSHGEFQSNNACLEDVFQTKLKEITNSQLCDTGLNQEQVQNDSDLIKCKFSSETNKAKNFNLIPNEVTSSVSKTNESRPNSDTDSVNSDSDNIETNINELNSSTNSDPNKLKHTTLETEQSNSIHSEPDMYVLSNKGLNMNTSTFQVFQTSLDEIETSQMKPVVCDSEPVDDTNIVINKMCEFKSKIDQWSSKNKNADKTELNEMCTKSSVENKILAEETTLTEEFSNETETLEINLTDDDLNIDGMGDEKRV